MRNWFVGGLLLSASLAVAKPLKVVATTSDLAAIAQAIAGETAVVRSITSGRENPHFLSARPGFVLMARDADLWLRVGMEMEVGWEPPILDGARNARIRPGQPGHLDLAAFVPHLHVPTGRVSRSEGDVHPAGNPHYWLDPLNGRRMATAIAERLGQLDPEHAEGYRQRAEAFRHDLDVRMFGAELVAAVGADRLWEVSGDGPAFEGVLRESGVAVGGWQARMAPLRGTRIVTYHKSWDYFAARFGLRVVAQLEPKPGVPPTAAHLAKVSDILRTQAVAAILQERFYGDKAAKRAIAGTDTRLVQIAASVGGQPCVEDYPALIDAIVAALTPAN